MLRKITLSLLVAGLASTGLVLAAASGAPTGAADRAATSDASVDAAADARRDATLPDAPREANPPDVLRADAPADQGVAEAAVPACITWHGEARYRPYGYDHVVLIRSSCARPADCTVSTSVNPEVKRVLVPANASVEVYTFLLSPAREFTAYVQCKLRG